MRKHLLVAIAATAALAISAFGPGLAGAETTPTGTTDTIYIKEVKGALKFVAPQTVTQGDELKIENTTDPNRVGPHTFSLVTQGSVPKTKSARQQCFTPKHICLAIAKWHGAGAKTPPTVNPVEVGLEGWDTEGSVTKKGDSWFTHKKSQSFEQPVSAAAGTTLHFICAVHPWMHGSVEVLPAG